MTDARLGAVRLLLHDLPTWSTQARELPGRLRSLFLDLGNGALAGRHLGEGWADELALRSRVEPGAVAAIRGECEHHRNSTNALLTAARSVGPYARGAGIDPSPLLALLEERHLESLEGALCVLRRVEDELLYPGIASGTESSGRLTEPSIESSTSLDARALALFIEHPDWTKKRIAACLKCNEKSLCPNRCPKLRAAIAAHKSSIDPGRRRLHGSKDAGGNLEAWDDG